MPPNLEVDPDQYLGQFLGDMYFLDRRVGKGAFACVYHAQRADHTGVAIKILHTKEPLAHLRFIREIKVMQALPPSANLVRYIDHGTLPAGGAFLAMEHVEGATLREKMRDGVISAEDACVVAYQIGLALQPLHRYGIVHRDLKPGNVLMAPDGTVKLFDFGLVLDSQGILKLFEEEDILKGRAFGEDVERGIIVGTPEYMALEQFEDARLKDPLQRQTCPASDVYSLGVIIYRLVTGEYPYPMHIKSERPNKREFLEYFKYRTVATTRDVPRPFEIDDALWSIITRAIGEPSWTRQPDGQSLAYELHNYLSSGHGTEDVPASSTLQVPVEALIRLAEEDGEELLDEDLLSGEHSISSVWPDSSSNRMDALPFPEELFEESEASITQEIELSDSIIIEERSITTPTPPGTDESSDQ